MDWLDGWLRGCLFVNLSITQLGMDRVFDQQARVILLRFLDSDAVKSNCWLVAPVSLSS